MWEVNNRGACSDILAQAGSFSAGIPGALGHWQRSKADPLTQVSKDNRTPCCSVFAELHNSRGLLLNCTAVHEYTPSAREHADTCIALSPALVSSVTARLVGTAQIPTVLSALLMAWEVEAQGFCSGVQRS